MKNRKFLILAFVGFGLALMIGVGLVVLRIQPSCWTSGTQPLIYSVELNESSSGQASLLKGTLQIRMREAPNPFSLKRPLYLEGQFKPLEFATNGQAYTQFRDFTYAFQIDVDSSCRVQKLSFDGRETFSARRTLQRLVRILALGREGQYTDFLGESDMRLTDAADQNIMKSFSRVGIRVPALRTTLEEYLELAAIKKSEFRF